MNPISDSSSRVTVAMAKAAFTRIKEWKKLIFGRIVKINKKQRTSITSDCHIVFGIGEGGLSCTSAGAFLLTACKSTCREIAS